jgi:hypothetical protein
LGFSELTVENLMSLRVYFTSSLNQGGTFH